MNSIHIDALRTILATKNGTLVPGAPNALAARIIADLGFEAVYLTGAGLTNMHLGLPDLGFMDLSQVVDHTIAIRGVVDMPLIVDADTGFGNALNVAHTVRTLERAGASAVQLEDQVTPKRCGLSLAKNLSAPRKWLIRSKPPSMRGARMSSSLREPTPELSTALRPLSIAPAVTSKQAPI
jgi:2-methylisocitrate lyase-like PEP mutase family enzyme